MATSTGVNPAHHVLVADCTAPLVHAGPAGGLYCVHAHAILTDLTLCLR